jgi:transcriptional regulator with XRE-family HTH domain
MANITNRIQKRREELGYTQEQLARLVGTTGPQINRLEKAQRKLTIEWLLRLCSALSCSADELVDLPVKSAKNKTCGQPLLSSLITCFAEAAAKHKAKPTPHQLGTWISLTYNDAVQNDISPRQIKSLIETIVLASKTSAKPTPSRRATKAKPITKFKKR